jgi:hypothetical protein
MKRVLSALFAVFALSAAAQQRIPGAEQHVTAPSALGQANKEMVAQPGDTLKQASCGRVLQGEPAQRPARTTLVRAVAPGAPAAGGAGDASYVVPQFPVSAPGPTGPPLVEAAYLTLRGTLSAFDKGLSVTIVDRSGRSRTIPLARAVRVDAGLKAGDAVAVRIPLESDPANKAASRVERQTAAAPAPMSSRSSKFGQAQTPGS